jgi:hypothetical protein
MLELVGDDASGVGCLLKDRVRDVAEFVDAVEQVAGGGTAFDPGVVRSLVKGQRSSELDELTERERTVLSLIAEGRSNRAIAKQLYLSLRAVERHVQALSRSCGCPTARTTSGGCSPCSRCSGAERHWRNATRSAGPRGRNGRSPLCRGAAARTNLVCMQLDVDILETTFDLVAPRGEELVDIFYARLFAVAPAVRPLFSATDLRRQKAMLLGTLVLLRKSFRDLDAIVPKLRALGARHVA